MDQGASGVELRGVLEAPLLASVAGAAVDAVGEAFAAVAVQTCDGATVGVEGLAGAATMPSRPASSRCAMFVGDGDTLEFLLLPAMR